jgi:guanylate kinase
VWRLGFLISQSPPAKGKLIVLSAPSGCGKTTIAKAILAKYPEILFSVSATTRPIRAGEVNGKDYFFLTKQEFDHCIQTGGLVEWEEIFGNYYGTLRSEILRALQQGLVMLFDIDVKGALSIRRHFPDNAVLIFIKPPSLEVLRARLEDRKTENSITFQRRLERVPMEMEQGSQFDFQVVNDKLPQAIDEVTDIIRKNSKFDITS